MSAEVNMITDNIQPQNMPIQIDYDDPDAQRKLIDAFRQVYNRINDLEEKIDQLESNQ